MKSIRIISTGVVLLTLAGCRSLGPRTMTRDRIDYSESISDSWKHQILLNIVKLRYMDTPVFLDVSQIVSGYSFETGVNLGGSLSPKYWDGDTFVESSVAGKYTDRPTITYNPMTGNEFLRGLLGPVPPCNLFYLVRSGYDAKFILSLGLESISGFNNVMMRAGNVLPADPDFIKAVNLWKELQFAGTVGMIMREGEDEKREATIFFEYKNHSEAVHKKEKELKRLLGLKEDQEYFHLVTSPLQRGPQKLALESHSIMQILAMLSTCVEVPESDIQEKRTVPLFGISVKEDDPIRIRCSEERPEDAFISVKYRKRWFWVSDQDWRSKRTMSILQFLFLLNDSDVEANLPQITIPAN